MVDPLKVLWVLTNSTYLVSKIFKTGTSDSEDAPYFEKSLYEVEVKEDENLHTPIIRISAQNHEEASNIRYEITGGNLGGLFAVDSQTGDVSLAAKLDYEAKKMYELRLSVTDEESISYTSLRVAVLDVNDNPPVFDKPLYRALVLEEDSTNLPKKILQVNVSDSDIDRPQDIVYFLTGPGVDADIPSNGKFSINRTSGEIYVLQPLDRDLPHGRPQWRFTVFAQDEGGEGLVGYADIHVNLQDVNDNAPIFLQTLSTTNLTENGTAGMVVVTMTATDQDDPLEGGNAQLVYNIEKNVLDEQTGTPIFNIEPHSGLIRTNICCLDREKTPDYSLQVVAMDGGGLKGTGTVSIIVSDINDMPPAFTKEEWVTEVSESEDSRIPDHAILTVNVIDQDETNDFYYKVVEGSGLGTDKFKMVRNPDGTGSLRVTNPLDYEDPLQSSGFRFKIQVNDQGPNITEDKNHVAYSWVVVRLRDINDNSPRFDKTSSTVSLQEDVEVGTLVDTFLARDPDQGGRGRVTYNINRGSDRRRHFHVSEEGRITVQRPLDRERSAIHKILITASDDGDPQRTTTATLTVNVLDVNDNAPRLLVDYHPIVLENTAPRTLLELFAQDIDDHAKGNGPPYTFQMDPTVNQSLDRLFSVDTNPRGDNGHGVAIVSSLVSFDREQHKEYHIPITIQDSGDPLMIGTSTLTVVIGDVNDNRMAAGSTDILVYKLKESREDTEVGRVYVEDRDDWDLPDKSFYWESSPTPQFHLDQETGTLRMSGDTAESDYRLRVRVRDSRHSMDTVVSSVTVGVRHITMADWYHSEVVTFQGVTDRDFVVKGNSTVSRLETFREVVGQLLETATDNVLVFSVQSNPGDSSGGGALHTGVRFCVKEHSEYFKPVRLLGEMLLHRITIESALSANISSVGEEQCQDEELCEGGSGCRIRRTILPALHVVNGNTTVLAGPRVEETAECVCDARDFSVPESCSSHSCLNGGTCYDTRQGPRCSCPEYHDGPRCQQMTRGFQGDGWAWYPSLQACSSSHLNLEFLTTGAQGQLLYNGPLGPPNPNSFFVTDFISVELVDGMPRLLLDLGSGTVNLTLGSRLDDGDWHRIDVIWDSEEVRLIVDQCRNRNLTDAMDREMTDDALMECQSVTALPPFSSQLNVHTPLQIGGLRIQPFLPGDYGWSAAPKGTGFNGCVKNIFYNGQIVDLAAPAMFKASSPGCPLTLAACRSCSPWSVCEGSLLFPGHRCRCRPGYSGPSCSSPTVPSTFLQGSFVKFALNFEPRRFSTTLQLRFRTREETGEIFRLVDQHHREYILLEIINKTIQVRMNLHGVRPSEQVVSLAHVNVSDGAWHAVKVSRHGSTLILQLDGGEGRKYNESFRFRGHQLLTVDKQEGVYAGGPKDQLGVKLNSVVTGFNHGCLDDIRLDGRLLPLPPGTNGSQWGQATVTRGLQRHCHSRNVCADVKCPDTFLCQDIWNDHICSCGDGKMTTSRGCEDRDECLDNPCLNGGFCVNQDSRIRYRCECPEGFWGQKCELVQERQSMRLGFGALFTIVGCIMFILVLVALFVAYNRRREAPTMKKPGPDDDVRENIISYNDEGGGEDDLNAFDLLPLKVPVKGLSSENKKLQVPELVEGTGLEARIEGRRKRADLEHTAPPYDDLRNYAFEGNCDSVVGSLSSLESCADAEDAVRYVVLGPRFARLVDIYSAHLEATDDSTLEATV